MRYPKAIIVQLVYKLKQLESLLGFKNEIKWISAIAIIFYHVFGTYWCWKYAFPVKWQSLIFAFVVHILAGMGITCGAHRYFTHRTYKVNTPLKIYLLICFCIAGQNSIYNWVRDHRLHHKFSDTEADPHNANRGLFFSHIGWLMMKKNEKVRKCGKLIDMSDIEGDRIIMFQEKYFQILKLVFCFVLPTLFGIYMWGESWRCAVAWQCFIRYLVMLHFELTVNSLAHMFGSTPYNKSILPKENSFVSLLTLGEGWHNYHHAFPFDFKASEHTVALDWSTAVIRLWARRGWAWDLKEASPEMVEATVNRLNAEYNK